MRSRKATKNSDKIVSEMYVVIGDLQFCQIKQYEMSDGIPRYTAVLQRLIHFGLVTPYIYIDLGQQWLR